MKQSGLQVGAILHDVSVTLNRAGGLLRRTGDQIPQDLGRILGSDNARASPNDHRWTDHNPLCCRGGLESRVKQSSDGVTL